MNSKSVFQTTLLDLNDDCLMHILNKLDAESLCSIHSTNRRLCFLSNYVFITTHRSTFRNPLIYVKDLNASVKRQTINLQALVIRIFGPLIKKIVLTNFMDENLMSISAFGKYLYKNLINLEELEIFGCYFPIEKLSSINDRNGLHPILQKLTIRQSYFDHDTFMRVCSGGPQLTGLHIDPLFAVFENDVLVLNTLLSFLHQNQQIRDLKCTVAGRHNFALSFLLLSKIESLSLTLLAHDNQTSEHDDVLDFPTPEFFQTFLSEMVKLKSFEYRSTFGSHNIKAWAMILPTLVNLERLCLCTESAKQGDSFRLWDIYPLKKLKFLRLEKAVISRQQYMDLATELPDLQEFELVFCKLDKHFAIICDFLMAAPNIQRIVIVSNIITYDSIIIFSGNAENLRRSKPLEIVFHSLNRRTCVRYPCKYVKILQIYLAEYLFDLGHVHHRGLYISDEDTYYELPHRDDMTFPIELPIWQKKNIAES